MMHEKTIWKPGIGEIANAFRGIAPWGAYSAPDEPSSCNGQHTDTLWVMAMKLNPSSAKVLG